MTDLELEIFQMTALVNGLTLQIADILPVEIKNKRKTKKMKELFEARREIERKVIDMLDQAYSEDHPLFVTWIAARSRMAALIELPNPIDNAEDITTDNSKAHFEFDDFIHIALKLQMLFEKIESQDETDLEKQT